MKMLTFIGGITVIVTLSAVGMVLWFFASLPHAEKLKNCLTTEMYKVHLCDKDPSFVQLDGISPYAVSAILVSEDASFFDHDGIDAEEIKESVIKDLKTGRFARGGSTITQQLAKNVFLSGEKSLIRKAQEIYLAFQIEKFFTKKRILTLYLNVVEFGPDIFGIKKASQFYFNKEPSQLTAEEGAFLAFLLPSPIKYSQSFKQKQLTDFASKSLQTILRKMYHARKLSEEEYVAAKKRAEHLFGAEASGEHLDENTLDKIIDQQGEGFKLEQEPEEYQDL